MVKADEIALWGAVRAERTHAKIQEPGFRDGVHELAEDLGIPYKRARYLALKWSDRGLYNYGVSWRVGWVEPEHESTELSQS